MVTIKSEPFTPVFDFKTSFKSPGTRLTTSPGMQLLLWYVTAYRSISRSSYIPDYRMIRAYQQHVTNVFGGREQQMIRGHLSNSLLTLLLIVKVRLCHTIGSLSTPVFERWTATGSEVFSLVTCLHTTTLTLLSIFSPLEIIGIKIWETPLSWHAKCSLPVAVRLSKTWVLKLPNVIIKKP